MTPLLNYNYIIVLKETALNMVPWVAEIYW